MASLRTLDIVHRLNAPTRAAAARRRRLRKAVAVACMILAAVVMMPAGRDDASGTSRTRATTVDTSGTSAALRGRHALAVHSLTPISSGAAKVDVWDGSGTRLARCAPTIAGQARSDTASFTGTGQSDVVTVALTDAEVTAVTRHLGRSDDATGRLVISACL